MAHLVVPHATLMAGVAIAEETGLSAAWNFTEGPVLGTRVSGHVRADTLLVSAPADAASPIWSGGAFGPEASPVALVVGLLALVAILALATRPRRLEIPADV